MFGEDAERLQISDLNSAVVIKSDQRSSMGDTSQTVGVTGIHIAEACRQHTESMTWRKLQLCAGALWSGARSSRGDLSFSRGK